MSSRFWRVILCCVLLLGSAGIYAQEPATTEFITAENFRNLKPLIQIHFADLSPDLGTFESGWFAADDDTSHIAVVNQDQEIVIAEIDDSGTVFTHLPQNLEGFRFVDAEFEDDGRLVALFSDGSTNRLALYSGDKVTTPQVELSGTPLDFWLSDESVWIEFLDNDSAATRLAVFDLDTNENEAILTEELPYAPENDEDAIVRIGRIPPPFVVTSDMTGTVKQWNLETSKTTAEVNLDGDAEPTAFGQINQSGSHMIWRDPQSQFLYLLDFSTGENQEVSELGSAYAQYLLLSHDADVAFAVNLNAVPNVFAWDTETGEFVDLGAYQACNRIPDIVRLSEDGKALIIGCDAGVEIWRVVNSAEQE